jgi:hypothetical protein
MCIKGREYSSEDIFLGKELEKRGFTVELVLPELLLPLKSSATDEVDVNSELLSRTDAVFFRNNYGGEREIEYRAALNQFVLHGEIAERKKVFNDFSGCKGDFCGKQHLLDLYASGFPVIPSTIHAEDLNTLAPFNTAERFMVKSMTGADSNGMQGNLTRENALLEFAAMTAGGDPFVIQPMVAFVYEVSFVFFGGEFMYAMYNGANVSADTGDSDTTDETTKRWALRVYDPTDADLEFAQRFVDWNSCERQIQRVDACRIRADGASGGVAGKDQAGELLLMELEDYCCWLSLAELAEQRPPLLKKFVDRLASSISQFTTGPDR